MFISIHLSIYLYISIYLYSLLVPYKTKGGTVQKQCMP